MIIPNLTFEEYSALPGFNSSLLKVADSRSLLHVKAYMDGEMEKESDALDFGHSFHEMLLRGREEFVVHPPTYPAHAKHDLVKRGEINAGDPVPWRANAGWCVEWLKKNAVGKVVHTEAEVASLRAMVAAVKSHPELAQYLNGQSEVAVTGESKGVAYKALVDLLPEDPSAPVIDFKKCRSAEPRHFTNDAVKFRYPIQAALNLDVLAWNGQKRPAFWFVAVEDTAPHAVWIMKMKDCPLSLLRVGRKRYRQAVSRILAAQDANEWPQYESGEPEEFLPGYMLAELEATG